MRNLNKIVFQVILFLTVNSLFAEGGQKNRQNNLYKTNGEPSYTKFNINNISTWIYNNGDSDQNRNGNSGFIYPKWSNKAVFYESGFLYGGKVDGQVRVGGSTYTHGQVPGKILQTGIAENPDLPHVRIYKVRRDYLTSDLTEDMEYNIQERYINGEYVIISRTPISELEEIRESYKKDWYEWPALDGAPFEDIDGDGIYNPDIDIPGYPGADQTIWFICNDLDEIAAKNLYGSPPIGIEMQATIWGYKNLELYKDMLFRKYVIINKSGKLIEDMYLSMWSDPDLGDATDDYVGCDTALSLGFVYNGDDRDATYNFQIPSGGFMLLQGPLIKGDSLDKGFMFNKIYNNKKNMELTSFVFYIGSDPVYSDPNLRDYREGTLETYNLIQGFIGTTGLPFISPPAAGSVETKFALSGDPINKTGWVDGMLHPPGDRRFMMNTGPFEMAHGDTQEVIYAQIAAGAFKSTDNLQSLDILKGSAFAIKNNWPGNFQLSSPNSLKLTGKGQDNKILLNWSLLGDSLSGIENYLSGIYKFEGYNVYQLPGLNSKISEYKRVATFDKINGASNILEISFDNKTYDRESKIAQFGNDTGIERFILLDKDYINNEKLHNGTPYYYVVSSYSYNFHNNTYLNTTESYSPPIKVIPQSNNPGISYELITGDKIEAAHIRGSAEAEIDVMVVDPSALSGHNYEINFYESDDNKIVWDLDDITENMTVLSNQKNINGTDEYIIVNGIRIIITQGENNLITENDLYRFTTPGIIYNEELAKQDVEKINIFPNPYYGYNPMETQKLGNFVMINHLPEKAVIRIFNLAGQLVRTLHKDSPDQFYLWDLQNEHQFLVASGLYILHIEMPDLGKVKVLKLAIILGTEVPDYY